MQKHYSVEKERRIVSAMCWENECRYYALENLETDMFWDTDIAIIYEQIKELAVKHRKLNFILIEDKIIKDYPKIEINKIIYNRDNFTGLEEFKELVKAISELAEIRKYKNLLTTANDLIENQASINYTEIKQTIENMTLQIITNKKVDDCISLDNANIIALKNIELAGKGNPGWIKTQYKHLDKVMIGFEPGTLSIIAARSSVGKSTLAFKMAYNIASNVTVDYYSFEMKGATLAMRNLASITGVKYWAMRYGNLKDDEVAEIVNAVGTSSKRNILINDIGGMEIDNLIARIKYNYQAKKTGIIFIDHLGFISSKKGENRNHQVAYITKQLKAVGKEMNLPIVLLCQLSRPAKDRKDKRPQKEDLRDSGEIEQDADLILMLYREDMEHEDDPAYAKDNIMTVFIRKQRDGARGKINFVFRPEYMQLEEIPEHGECI